MGQICLRERRRETGRGTGRNVGNRFGKGGHRGREVGRESKVDAVSKRKYISRKRRMRGNEEGRGGEFKYRL